MNALMFRLAAWKPGTSAPVRGFGPALLGSVLLSLLNVAVAGLLGGDPVTQRRAPGGPHNRLLRYTLTARGCFSRET